MICHGDVVQGSLASSFAVEIFDPAKAGEEGLPWFAVTPSGRVCIDWVGVEKVASRPMPVNPATGAAGQDPAKGFQRSLEVFRAETQWQWRMEEWAVARALIAVRDKTFVPVGGSR